MTWTIAAPWPCWAAAWGIQLPRKTAASWTSINSKRKSWNERPLRGVCFGGLSHQRSDGKGGGPGDQVFMLLKHTLESFYCSPPNFSLTKSPVSKPTHPAVSPDEIRCPLPPRCHRSIVPEVLCKHEHVEDAFSIASFLVSSNHETFVEENRRFCGDNQSFMHFFGIFLQFVSLQWVGETAGQGSPVTPFEGFVLPGKTSLTCWRRPRRGSMIISTYTDTVLFLRVIPGVVSMSIWAAATTERSLRELHLFLVRSAIK